MVWVCGPQQCAGIAKRETAAPPTPSCRTKKHKTQRYEEEPEYDAITEVFQAKAVTVATPDAARTQLPALRTARFSAAFAAPPLQRQAEELWAELGRAGPPLFLKVRARAPLADLAVGVVRGMFSCVF